jgi:hypothetical protein
MGEIMLQATIPIRETTQESYSVCVASHLASDWCTLGGLVTLMTSYNANGLPITTLELRVDDRTQLLRILTGLHEANLAILSLNLLRDTEQLC